jgi:uncharacterized membrane protein
MKVNFFFIFKDQFNRVRVVVYNAISINISAITWRSVLLGGGGGGGGGLEKTTDLS